MIFVHPSAWFVYLPTREISEFEKKVEMNHPNFMMRDPIGDLLPEMADHCSRFIYGLVERMWAKKPETRPTAAEVLNWCNNRKIPPCKKKTHTHTREREK